MPIYRAIRLEHGQGRILIERWALSDEPRLCNIARRDSEGRVIWRAELPDTPGRECFIAMRRVGDAVLATTYQGVEVLLDMATGLHLALSTQLAPAEDRFTPPAADAGGDNFRRSPSG